jgi:predicted nucleic acid-binding protein
LPVDESTIDEALSLDFKDFEDAIQYVAAKNNNMDFIITRNKNDYENSKISVLNAREFLELSDKI